MLEYTEVEYNNMMKELSNVEVYVFGVSEDKTPKVYFYIDGYSYIIYEFEKENGEKAYNLENLDNNSILDEFKMIENNLKNLFSNNEYTYTNTEEGEAKVLQDIQTIVSEREVDVRMDRKTIDFRIKSINDNDIIFSFTTEAKTIVDGESKIYIVEELGNQHNFFT